MIESDPREDYSEWVSGAFDSYSRWYLKRHFNAVRVAADSVSPPVGGPTIFYCNHSSWWDPVALLFVIKRVYPGIRIFAPIEARALERYSILRRIGLFPLEPGHVGGTRAFIEHADRILSTAGSALGVTAQGAFMDVRQRPSGIRKGVAHLLCADASRQAIPLAAEYVFWNERLPEILVRFGPGVRAEPADNPRDSLRHTHARLDQALTETQDSLAGQSIARDPKNFDLLLDGRRGAGWMYDLYERFRHRLRGRGFERSHSGIGT